MPCDEGQILRLQLEQNPDLLLQWKARLRLMPRELPLVERVDFAL
jgi:hypothetical protein